MKKIVILPVLFILTHGLCFSADQNSSLTIWQVAAQGNEYQASIQLRSKVGVVNEQQPKTGKTPLMCATKAPNSSMINFLVRHGADVSIVCAKNRTALEYAVRREQVEHTKALLASKNIQKAAAEAFRNLTRGQVSQAVSGFLNVSKKRLPIYGESQQTLKNYRLALKLHKRNPSPNKLQIIHAFNAVLSVQEQRATQDSVLRHHLKRHPVDPAPYTFLLGESGSESDNEVLSDADEGKRE